METPRGMSEHPKILAVALASHGVLMEFQMPDRLGVLPSASLGAGAVRFGLPSRVTGTRLVFTSGHWASRRMGARASVNARTFTNVVMFLTDVPPLFRIPSSAAVHIEAPGPSPA